MSRAGRVRRRRLDAAPLSAAFGWLARYRVLREDRFDRLASLVEVHGAPAPFRDPKEENQTMSSPRV